MTKTRIRRARADDASRLSEIAHAAKRHWGYAEDLLALWETDLTVTSAFIATHPVYCAPIGTEVVGFYALSPDGENFEMEHMWVWPKHMGKGVGAALFEHAVRYVRASQGSALTIASDPNAEGFYRRVGARRIGEVPSTPAGRMLPLLIVDIHPAAASE